MPKVRIVVDNKRCIGSGSCEITDPNHFRVNSKGKAELRVNKKEQPVGNELIIEVTAQKLKLILEAAKYCPTNAISVFDEKGELINL